MSQLPIWAIALILFTLCINILFPGRNIFEGLAYNISYASQIGDTALIVTVLIMATILQREKTISDTVVAGSGYQIILSCACVYVGGMWQVFIMYVNKWKRGSIMDIYHNIFIVPLFFFLFLTMTPVLRKYGTETERYFCLLLFFSWFGVVLYDLATGRLKQPEFMCKWIRERSKSFLEYHEL